MHESLPVNSPVLSAERTMPLEHHNRRKAGEKTLALSVLWEERLKPVKLQETAKVL